MVWYNDLGGQPGTLVVVYEHYRELPNWKRLGGGLHGATRLKARGRVRRLKCRVGITVRVMDRSGNSTGITGLGLQGAFIRAVRCVHSWCVH